MKNGGVASGSSGGSRFCSLEQCVLLSDLLLFPPTLTSLVPVGRWFHIVCRCVFISFDFSVFWLCLCQLSLPDVYISLLCGLWRVVRGASPSFSTNVQKLVSSFQKKHVTFCHSLLATTFGKTKQETRKVRLTGSIMQVPSRFKIRPVIQVGEAVVAVVPLPNIDIDRKSAGGAFKCPTAFKARRFLQANLISRVSDTGKCLKKIAETPAVVLTKPLALLLRRRSVTAPLLPLIVAPLRILPRRRAAPRLLPTASLRCGRVAQLLLSYSPNRFATAAPLLYTAASPLRAAPRHSAACCQLCTAPPRCCRTASLLPRRFATALHSASSSRMRLNQSLLGLEHSKTCSASCTVGACLLQHRCFLCIAPFCTAPSVSTVQSAWTLTSWGSSRSQERIAIMIRMMVCVVTVTVVVSIVIHTLLVPNEDPLRKATQARFPSPLSNCLVCRCNSY